MTKQEEQIIDKYLIKMAKLKGEIRPDKDGDAQQHWVWIKKADITGLINKLVKELKELEE